MNLYSIDIQTHDIFETRRVLNANGLDDVIVNLVGESFHDSLYDVELIGDLYDDMLFTCVILNRDKSEIKERQHG